jgi:HAD superfamily hydrolase (TIGR01490 family)
MALALYDLDRTAIAVNSATLWVRRQYREGRISTKTVLEAGLWLSFYRSGLMTMDRALHRAVASMEGHPEDDLAARTEQFWREECLHTVRPGARRAIERHRAQGHRNVLSTSSSPWISRLAVAELGLDDYLCTDIEVGDDGLLTGRIAGTPNFGEGKLTRLRGWAAERGVALEDVWFYTDSAADLPLMLAAGHPVCVAPDPKLAREARRRGWPVEDWDR